MDSDRILVIDAGLVVEFDHPHNLLKNKNGHLYKLVAQTGQNNANKLHNIAEQVLFLLLILHSKLCCILYNVFMFFVFLGI